MIEWTIVSEEIGCILQCMAGEDTKIGGE